MWLLEKVCKSGVEKSTKREKLVIYIPPRIIIIILKLRIKACVRHVVRTGKMSNAHNWVGRFE